MWAMIKNIIPFGTELNTDQIKKMIEDKRRENSTNYTKLWDYYQGNNPPIMNRKSIDSTRIDHKTPIGFARKLVNTVVGYMFKPGHITYKSELSGYLDNIIEYNKLNKEQIKTAQLGMNASIYGEAYELHYPKGAQGAITPKAEMRYAVIDPREVIMVYDDLIEPGVATVIRFYESANIENLTEIYVYYTNKILHYKLKIDDSGNIGTIALAGEEPNYIGMVPWNWYYNTPDIQSDIEPVRELMDAYDIIISDSVNEFCAFAAAYLVLEGMKIKREDARTMKENRIMELIKDAKTYYLTKTVDTAFIDSMANRIKQLIHVVSQIPDFTDERFQGNISGVAINRLLFDFETLAATKQSYFEDGLKRRYEIFDAYNRLIGRNEGTVDDLTIEWKRNLPNNLSEIASTAQVMMNTLSQKTIISTYPETLVPDVDKEMQQIEEEKAGTMPDLNAMPNPDLPVGITSKPAQTQAAPENIKMMQNNADRMTVAK
jgi:SPP1 family phage portal protein